MHTKKFYVRENDRSSEDCQEITFLFESNCKGTIDKVNKSDFLYQIASVEDFYSILQNDKKVLEHGGNFIRGTLVNLGYSILKSDIEYSDDLALAFEIYQVRTAS